MQVKNILYNPGKNWYRINNTKTSVKEEAIRFKNKQYHVHLGRKKKLIKY